MDSEKNFSDLIRSLREGRQLTVAALAEEIKIPSGTLYAYESGRRGVPRDKANILRVALATSTETRDQFERAYAAAIEDRGPLHEKFGSESTRLLVADLNYPPFSGTPGKSFVNRFLEEMLNLAVIKIEEPTTPTYAEHASSGLFDVEERMKWIVDRKAQVVVNLQSPMRMLALRFLPLPIRVSLNAVITSTDEEAIRAARQLLVEGKRDPKHKFQVVAIKNEVGHIFLKETGKVSPQDVVTANTLNAKELAERLEPNMGKMLVCDEITALAVIAEKKKGTATLVLPPSTDQSVMHFSLRRKLPGHYLGLGVGRDQDNELLAYLTEAIQNFLSTELEVVAEMLEDLYRDLVSQTKASFEKNSFLYSGELLRLSQYQRENHLERELHDQYQSRAIETLVEQNARSYARRCLNVSKRSIAENSDDLWPWRHVLRRTRERVLILEARNRVAVREIVVSAMKSALGLDPVGNFSESYGEYFKRATSPEYWPDFKDMLERELDITLLPSLNPMQQYIFDNWIGTLPKTPNPSRLNTLNPFMSLEFMVSTVQRAMEENSGAARPVSVRSEADYPGDWATIFGGLWREYRRDVGRDEMSVPEPQPIRLVAFSLGQAVGFVSGLWVDFRGGGALQVDHMFVIEGMRNSGISRRLIRALIDSVQIVRPKKARKDWDCHTVWVHSGFRPDVVAAFERTGFIESETDPAYFYRLYGTSDPAMT